MDMYQKLMQCYESVRAKTSFEPKVAVVLGSGLGNYADNIDIVDTVLYRDIDNFPVSTAPGHKGQFVFGYVDKVPVVIMQGRVHCYEGYSSQDVVLPIRLMGLLGAKRILLTNAAGSCNPDYQAGNFMLIRDHITSFVPSPLIGPNLEKLGPRFPDMSDVYKANLREIIKKEAEELNIKLREGVYVQLTGPNFETPQEVEFYRSAGADAAGMSTAIEAMAATHMGMEVCGISCISNLGAGLSDLPLTEEEVIETANRVAPLFTVFVTNILKAIA